jgi:HEAT repeat protein
MSEWRLGDVIDDHCIKCRRVTNHSIVSLMDGAAAKVRCRTCYHDHDYRHEQAPPSKKELKRAEAEAAALAAAAADGNNAVPEALESVDGVVPALKSRSGHA